HAHHLPASTIRSTMSKSKVLSSRRANVSPTNSNRHRRWCRLIQQVAAPTSTTRPPHFVLYETEQNLVEQINELIRVHSAQLLEKDQELREKQEEIAELRLQLEKEEKNRINDYNTMKQKYEKEIAAMSSELESIVESSRAEKTEAEQFISELKAEIDMMGENIKNINSLNSDLEYQLAEANINMVEMKNEYASLENQLHSVLASCDSLVKERIETMDHWEKTTSEKLAEVEAVAEKKFALLGEKMRESLKMLREEVNLEYQSSDKLLTFVNSLADDVGDNVDMFRNKLDALQEVISVMAADFEQKINELMVVSMPKLWDLSESKLEENLRLTEDLQVARALGLEKDIIVQDLQATIDELRTNLNQMSQQCRKFEIVQNEATKTIDVLSQRLYESESEVERLNDTTNELCLRRDALEEKVKSVVNENGLLKMEINELQESIVRDVKEVEAALLAKVESYRRLVGNETRKFKQELSEKQKTIEMLMSEVDFYRNKAIETETYLAKVQNKVIQYENEIRDLTNNYFRSIEEEYTDKLNAQKVLNIALSNELNESKKIAQDFRESSMSKMADLESQLGDMHQLKIGMEERILTLERQNTELTQEQDVSRQSIVNLEKEVEQKNVKIVELTEEIENLSGRLQDLENGLALYKQHAERSSQQVAKMTKETADLTERVESMTETLAEKDLKLAEVTRDFEDCKLYNESLTSRIEQLDSMCKHLEQESEQKSMTLIQVSEEYDNIRKLHGDECSKSEELEKYIGEMVSDLMIEKQKCSNLESEVQRQSERVSAGEESIADLEKRLASAESMNDELVSQVVDMKKEKEALLSKVEQLQKEAEQIEKQKEDILKEKDDVFEIVKRQWEERDLLISRIANQEEEIEELRNVNRERCEQEKAIFQAELQNEIFALQQNLEDSQKRIIDLESRESSLLFQFNSAEAELVASEEERERQEAALKELVEKLASLETKYATVEKRKNEYKIYAKQLETEKSSMKQELEQAAEERERMLDDKKECTALERQIDELTSKNQELETIIGPFQEQLVAFDKERTALLAKSEIAEKELQALSVEHAKALGHRNNKQKIQRIVQLAENIATLKKVSCQERIGD
ncbi:unnamed protein product, partial [Nesidiocoris tenuis]